MVKQAVQFFLREDFKTTNEFSYSCDVKVSNFKKKWTWGKKLKSNLRVVKVAT